MASKGFGESAVLLHDGSLEANNVVELIFPQERTAGVNFPAIFIFVAPSSGDIEVFKGESKWVQLGVATGAIRVFPVLGKLLADRLILWPTILI